MLRHPTYEACRDYCKSNNIDFTYKKPDGDTDYARTAMVDVAAAKVGSKIIGIDSDQSQIIDAYGKTLREACVIGTRLASTVICTSENICPRFMPEEFGLTR